MILKHPYRGLFLVSAVLIALVFWRQNDWWVTVDLGPDVGRIRKFELPWWIKLPVSAMVGVAGGGVSLWIVWGTTRLIHHFSRPRPAVLVPDGMDSPGQGGGRLNESDQFSGGDG